jgi:hypothetical protein
MAAIDGSRSPCMSAVAAPILRPHSATYDAFSVVLCHQGADTRHSPPPLPPCRAKAGAHLR